MSLNLREAYVKEILSAREHLAGGKENHDTAIHEARRHLKRARSILKLLRSSFGEIYERENARLRRIARRLAIFRDAAAMIEAFDDLGRRKFSSVREGLVAVKRELEAGAGMAELLEKTAAALTPGKPWPAEAIKPAVITKGLRLTWQQGKKALSRLQHAPMPENFHQLRKRIKAYRFQLRFTGVEDKTLDALDKCLGEAHNLAVLDRWIVERPGRFGSEVEVDAFRRFLRERRVRLQAKALTEAARFYARKPGQTGHAAIAASSHREPVPGKENL